MQTPESNDDKSRSTRKGAGSTIGFRLNPAELRQLSAMAESEGVSVHEMARRLVLGGLRAGAGGAGAEVVTELIGALRRDLAVVTEAVLVLGRTLSPEEAKRFVAEKFD